MAADLAENFLKTCSLAQQSCMHEYLEKVKTPKQQTLRGRVNNQTMNFRKRISINQEKQTEIFLAIENCLTTLFLFQKPHANIQKRVIKCL